MNVGLVLSGGGIKGVAHIGAIKALEEHDMYPTHISGSSAGAVVGAFYAYGYSPHEILSFFKSLPLFSISRYAFRKPGIIDTDRFYNDFKKFFPEDNFTALKKHLFITAVDMLNGKVKIFKEGPLIRSFLASAAFPGVFSPMLIDNIVYADGGILDNFPIAPIKQSCSQLIGVYASPLATIHANRLKHSYNVLDRAIKINFSSGSQQKFEQCDLLIRPEQLTRFGLFDKNNMDEIFDIGYTTAIKEIKQYKNKLYPHPKQRSYEN